MPPHSPSRYQFNTSLKITSLQSDTMADDEAQTAPTVTALTSGNSMKGDLTALLKGLGREVCDVPTCKERSALAVFCDERKMPDPRVHENSVGALLRILSELPRGGSHPGFKKYKARACSSAHLAVCLDIRDEKSAELGWCGDDYYYALEPHDDPRDTLVQEVIEVGARKTDVSLHFIPRRLLRSVTGSIILTAH